MDISTVYLFTQCYFIGIGILENRIMIMDTSKKFIIVRKIFLCKGTYKWIVIRVVDFIPDYIPDTYVVITIKRGVS
jgi:hypothetical protein